MHRIHSDFTYKFGSTTLSTEGLQPPVAEKRTGVCQDFAHFMVSGLRSLGLAGRYVSGYLATWPAPAAVDRDAPATLGSAVGFRVPAGCTSTRPMTASSTTHMPAAVTGSRLWRRATWSKA